MLDSKNMATSQKPIKIFIDRSGYTEQLLERFFPNRVSRDILYINFNNENSLPKINLFKRPNEIIENDWITLLISAAYYLDKENSELLTIKNKEGYVDNSRIFKKYREANTKGIHSFNDLIDKIESDDFLIENKETFLKIFNVFKKNELIRNHFGSNEGKTLREVIGNYKTIIINLYDFDKKFGDFFAHIINCYKTCSNEYIQQVEIFQEYA